MKKMRQWALLLCTLMLTLTGAALPYAVSAIQDAGVEKLREDRPLDAVSLTLMQGGGVQEVLQLLAGSTSELDWQGTTKLAEEDAASAAEDTLRWISGSGLVPGMLLPDEINFYAAPHVVMSMSRSNLSAVVWLCWSEEIPGSVFFVDDETGKMVRMVLWTAVSSNVPAAAAVLPMYEDAQPEALVQRAEQWRIFLSEYYGMELYFGDYESYDAGLNGHCTFNFDIGGLEGKGKVGLELQDVAVYFNL